MTALAHSRNNVVRRENNVDAVKEQILPLKVWRSLPVATSNKRTVDESDEASVPHATYSPLGL